MHILFIEGGTVASSDLWSTLTSYITLSVLTPSCFKNKLKAFTVVKGAQ